MRSDDANSLKKAIGDFMMLGAPDELPTPILTKHGLKTMRGFNHKDCAYLLCPLKYEANET